MFKSKAKKISSRSHPQIISFTIFLWSSFNVKKKIVYLETYLMMSCSNLIQATPIDVVLPFFSRICCPQQCNSFNCCLGFLRTQQGIVKQFEWKLAAHQAAEVVVVHSLNGFSPLVSTQWHQVGFINIWCVAKPSRWPLLVYKLIL